MPSAPHIAFERRHLTDKQSRSVQEAMRTGYVSFDSRTGSAVRMAWRRYCERLRVPLVEVERRRSTAEVWADIWPNTPSFCVFSQELEQELRCMLARMGVRFSISLHTVRICRVPMHLADPIAAELVRHIRRWRNAGNGEGTPPAGGPA